MKSCDSVRTATNVWASTLSVPSATVSDAIVPATRPAPCALCQRQYEERMGRQGTHVGDADALARVVVRRARAGVELRVRAARAGDGHPQVRAARVDRDGELLAGGPELQRTVVRHVHAPLDVVLQRHELEARIRLVRQSEDRLRAWVCARIERLSEQRGGLGGISKIL